MIRGIILGALLTGGAVVFFRGAMLPGLAMMLVGGAGAFDLLGGVL